MGSPHLDGTVALVAGATRGCGRAIAVELARAGAYVYATGRSSRAGRSEIDRPETIEDTGDLIAEVGNGVGLVVDHEQPEAVSALVDRIRSEQGRLDILINDIFGGDRYADWEHPLWESDLTGGLRMLRMGVDTHLITATYAIPLMLQTAADHDRRGLLVEMTDGTHEYNREFRQAGMYYDLVKATVERILIGLTFELRERPITPVAVTPGWIRSEAMLDNFGVTEENWCDAIAKQPGFAISESPTYVARGIAALAADQDIGGLAGKVLTSRQLSNRYGVTDADGSRPDCWTYITENGRSAMGSDPRNIDAYR